MNWGSATRTRKITSLIVVSSIIGLSLMALLPWISVTEITSSGETVTVYNIAMMEKSDDGQIGDIAKDLELISSFFWLVIIFGILSFVGIVLYVSKKHSSLAQLIMVLGCATIIFSILVVFLLWNWIKNIESMEAISVSLIGSLSIKYAYLPLLVGVISLIGSVSYTGFATYFSIKRIIGSIKQKKSAEKQYDQKSMLKQFSKKDEQTIIKKTPIVEKQELPKQIRPIEKTSLHEIPSEPEQEKSKELEKPVMQKQPFTPEKLVSEEQPLKPVPSETVQEQPQESEELPTSPLFEKALSSAIEKRQPEIEKEETERQPVKKKISVRCPECKNVFTIEKDEDITRIECPKCGKKGIAK